MPITLEVRLIQENSWVLVVEETKWHSESGPVSVEPEVSTRKLEVETAWVEEVLMNIETLTVPVAPDLPCGYDGGYTEVEIHGKGGYSAFSWWCQAPEGWSALESLSETVLEQVERRV